MFQDNVCHDLAVNKATQPSKYYGAGQAAKVRSRAAEGPAEDEAAPPARQSPRSERISRNDGARPFSM